MIESRVERHIIDRQHKYYKMLKEKCHLAKNVYNHGNYIIRQEFTKNGKWLRYEDVEKIVKSDLDYPDYWNLGLANSSQQILRTLDKNWKSFFKALKRWQIDKTAFCGKPKIPKYKKKDGLCTFALTTNQAKLKSDNLIHFPKTMNGFTIKPNFINKSYKSFRQVRIKPENDNIIVELVYTIDVQPLTTTDKNNYLGIDLGIDNFVTMVNNVGCPATIINGKGLKSVNKYYNKLVAKEKSKLDKSENSKVLYSHKLYSITNKRNNKINYFMHKASRYVVNYCLEHSINNIVIGHNKDWKRNSNLGKVNNQTFVQIPHRRFIDMLDYKCRENNIKLHIVEEPYTSGTSFLDNEKPIESNYNKERRISRGLFKTNTGKYINADVNAAYQIIKNVFCNVEIPADIGLVMNPVRINLC